MHLPTPPTLTHSPALPICPSLGYWGCRHPPTQALFLGAHQASSLFLCLVPKLLLLQRLSLSASSSPLWPLCFLNPSPQPEGPPTDSLQPPSLLLLALPQLPVALSWPAWSQFRFNSKSGGSSVRPPLCPLNSPLLPKHATLMYWAPCVSLHSLSQQDCPSHCVADVLPYTL